MSRRSRAASATPPSPHFPANSRYAHVSTATFTEPDGSAVPFLQRRFCPRPEALSILTEAVVHDPDRPDSVAARTLGDPLQWWRIADSNTAMDPLELTDLPGRRLRVPVPQNLPQP
jgi:hypothetical protein